MACLPPSTGSVTPVLKEASSEARKAMARATSAASPGRPSACVVLECSRNLSYFSWSRPPRFCSSVMMTPGLTLLTRTCLAASSSDTHLVN